MQRIHCYIDSSARMDYFLRLMNMQMIRIEHYTSLSTPKLYLERYPYFFIRTRAVEKKNDGEIEMY